MRSFTYPVHLKPSSEGGFVVTCRDVPEAITQGDTLQEALDEAADALDEALQGRIEDGEDIPPVSRARKGEYLVAPPVGTALKLAVYLALRDAKLSRSELAHRLDGG
jgi:antitoxin HicB